MISPFAKWYRTGTVSVTQNSPVVAGVGTNWAFGSSIREGDLFTIDGAKFYEVQSVTGTGSMTLRTPYLEATQADIAYSVIRNFAVIPATDIIIRCLETTDIWKTFQDQMYDWQTKPYNAITPATVSFKGLDGVETVIKSLPQVVGETNIASTKGTITVVAIGTAATTQNIDWSAAGHRSVVINQNTTFTFTDPTDAARLTLLISRSGAGPYTITLPANVRDKNGAAIATITVNAPVQVLDFVKYGGFYYKVNS